MQSVRRRPVWYIVLGAATATLAIVAGLRPLGSAVHTPSPLRTLTLAAVILIAQAATLAAFWRITSADRVTRDEMATLHDDLAALRRHLDHIDENTELLAERTARLTDAKEIRRTIPRQPVLPVGITRGRVRSIIDGEEPIPTGIDPATVAAIRRIARQLNGLHPRS